VAETVAALSRWLKHGLLLLNGPVAQTMAVVELVKLLPTTKAPVL
jgi:type IV secretory pathway VirB2 component (pilin)